MAGIFGGQASGVDAETTKDVILEAAFCTISDWWDVQDKYGLHTDSSHRFERGVDFTLQRHVMKEQQHCYSKFVAVKQAKFL